MNRRRMFKLFGAAIAALVPAPTLAQAAPAPVPPPASPQWGGMVAGQAETAPIHTDHRSYFQQLAQAIKDGKASIYTYGCHTSPEEKALVQMYAQLDKDGVIYTEEWRAIINDLGRDDMMIIPFINWNAERYKRGEISWDEWRASLGDTDPQLSLKRFREAQRKAFPLAVS